MKYLTCTLLILAMFCAGAAAQGPSFLRQHDGAEGFGFSVAGAGDVNRDGFQDYVVGDPSSSGTVWIYSGLDASVIWTLSGKNDRDRLGWAVSAAGDVNGDGFADVAASATGRSLMAPGAGAVYVLSGRTGAVIWTTHGDGPDWHWGESLAAVGDVNLDGHDDLLVASASASPHGVDSGVARLYSGRDGSMLFEVMGGLPGERVGSSVARMGDLDLDGVPDFVVGADGDSSLSPGRGSATIYSGADSRVLQKFHGASDLDAFGATVSGGGDANGDLIPDLLVGAPGSSVPFDGSGSVHIFSGADGSELGRIEGPFVQNRFGARASFCGDMNGDGRDDLLVGDPRGGYDGNLQNPGEGWCWVYSGSDGSLIDRLEARFSRDRFGFSVAPIGDSNADGREDFLVGAPAWGGARGAYVQVYGASVGYNDLHHTVPRPLTAGDYVNSTVTGATPDQPVSLYVGKAFGRTYLPGIGSLQLQRPVLHHTQWANSVGAARLRAYVPPHRVGEVIWFQVIDALGRVSVATMREIL